MDFLKLWGETNAGFLRTRMDPSGTRSNTMMIHLLSADSAANSAVRAASSERASVLGAKYESQSTSGNPMRVACAGSSSRSDSVSHGKIFVRVSKTILWSGSLQSWEFKLCINLERTSESISLVQSAHSSCRSMICGLFDEDGPGMMDDGAIQRRGYCSGREGDITARNVGTRGLGGTLQLNSNAGGYPGDSKGSLRLRLRRPGGQSPAGQSWQQFRKAGIPHPESENTGVPSRWPGPARMTLGPAQSAGQTSTQRTCPAASPRSNERRSLCGKYPSIVQYGIRQASCETGRPAKAGKLRIFVLCVALP